MGQLLIVQGEDRRTASEVFEEAVSRLGDVCGMRPSDRLQTAAGAVAKFPRWRAPSENVFRDSQRGAWLASAGACFRRGNAAPAALCAELVGQRDSEDGQRRLLNSLDGAFVIACSGATPEELWVITDRIGSLHVYATEWRRCLVICTSALTLAALARRDWDTRACREFLATGSVFENRSLFQGVTKLAPATLYRFRGAATAGSLRYWEPAGIGYDAAPLGRHLERLSGTLDEALAAISATFARPVFDLTGGFDSRILVAAMLRRKTPFHTVVNGPASSPDVLTAGRIARQFHLAHRHQEPRPWAEQTFWSRARAATALTDGECNVLEYLPTLDHQSRLASQFDVSVNGSGGELAKGYWWELLIPFTGSRHYFPARRIAAARFAYRRLPKLLLERFDETTVEHMAEVIARATAPLAGRPNTAKMDQVYLGLRLQRWQGRIASATCRLWPCVSPFLFRPLLEAVLAVPGELRAHHRLSRNLIEHLSEMMGALPLASGCPASPMRLTNIHRFSPWVWAACKHLCRDGSKKVLKAIVPADSGCYTPTEKLWELQETRELLDPDSMLSRPLYDASSLRAFLAFSRRTGFSDRTHLGRIVTLELAARAARV